MLKSINPATEQVINSYKIMDPSEIKSIINSVNSSFEKWRWTDFNLRSKLMQKAVRGDAGKGKSFSLPAYVQALTEMLTTNHPDVPFYFALTVNKQFFKPMEDHVYIVGLAFRYSPKRVDNLALVKKNLEQNFRLDYLNYDWYADQHPGKRLMAQLNLNYTAPMLMLAEHYHASGDAEKAKEWKQFPLKT